MYANSFVSPKEKLIFSQNIQNPKVDHDPKLTPYEHSNLIALHEAMMHNSTSPNTNSAITYFQSPEEALTKKLLNEMRQKFFHNVNERLFNMTNFQILDVLKSCHFNLNENCWKESRFVRLASQPTCFTFNRDKREKVNSVIGGLEMVFNLNATQMTGSSAVSKSFQVVVHDPDEEPSLTEDGIDCEMGKITTIKIKRSVVNRENIGNVACNESLAYTKRNCLKECVLAKCIANQRGRGRKCLS